MRRIEKKEVLLVGVRIWIPKTTKVAERYKCIFHGKTELSRGHYFYWYPCKSIEHSRLIHQLERWYKIKIQYGYGGSIEV